jgi:hypothetical protein
VSDQNLGRALSTHGVDPALLQRGVFIVVLSLLFFLGTMLLYYWRQGLGYFLLATAFLVIYLVTMFSFVMLRRYVVTIYEAGFIYRGRKVSWRNIDNVSPTGEIIVKDGKPINLPRSLRNFGDILDVIREHSSSPR